MNLILLVSEKPFITIILGQNCQRQKMACPCHEILGEIWFLMILG